MGNSRSTSRRPIRRRHTISGATTRDEFVSTTTLNKAIKGTVFVIVKDEKEIYNVNIQPKAKVQHVKIILTAQYGVELSEGRVITYNGLELEDEKTLQEYGFTSGDTLQISQIEEKKRSPEDDLIDAALQGDLTNVQNLISRGVSVNGVGFADRSHGHMALHAAAEGGREEVVRFLLKNGALVDARDGRGLTPLLSAASGGHVNVFRLLLKEGADLNAEAESMKVIHFAALGGQVYLLEHLANICDLTEPTDDLRCTLHLAALHGNLETAVWLVEQGINFNLEDSSGKTAEDLARENDHSDVAHYLKQWTLLQERKFLQVAAQGNVMNLMSFLNIGVDVECKSQDDGKWGLRAIHLAALKGHTEIINALLRFGAQLNAEDDMGNTAAHYAAAGGHIGTLKFLKTEGCGACVCNNLNMTPLHFAAATGQLATASWLLAQEGVQANVTSTSELTASDVAEGQGYYALVDVLRKHQASQKLRVRPADMLTVERKLGRGFMTEVYLASMNNRKIIVKKIKFPEAALKDLESCLHESLAFKRLKHPNIVTYVGSKIQASDLHIMMEYCNGGDLSQIICKQRAKREPFEEKLLLEWTTKITLALKYIHERNILHRNLKPSNVFLSTSGAIKLGDFGLVRTASDTSFKRLCDVDKAYVSPEVSHNKPYDDKAEIWSFGCILYELVTFKQIIYRINDEVPGRYSQQYKQLVSALLNKDSEKRPSAYQVVNLLALENDKARQERQRLYLQQLREVDKELCRPIYELMKGLLKLG